MARRPEEGGDRKGWNGLGDEGIGRDREGGGRTGQNRRG